MKTRIVNISVLGWPGTPERTTVPSQSAEPIWVRPRHFLMSVSELSKNKCRNVALLRTGSLNQLRTSQFFSAHVKCFSSIGPDTGFLLRPGRQITGQRNLGFRVTLLHMSATKAPKEIRYVSDVNLSLTSN